MIYVLRGYDMQTEKLAFEYPVPSNVIVELHHILEIPEDEPLVDAYAISCDTADMIVYPKDVSRQNMYFVECDDVFCKVDSFMPPKPMSRFDRKIALERISPTPRTNDDE